MKRLEARVGELREEARTLEVLNRTGIAIGAELDLERLVQIVTDAGVELSGAQFGAFFYNSCVRTARSYTLYTSRERRAKLLRAFRCRAIRQVFEPTFRGKASVRSADILADPRYGKSEPYRGCRPAICRSEAIWLYRVVSRGAKCLAACSSGTPSRECSLRAQNASGRIGSAGRSRDR